MAICVGRLLPLGLADPFRMAVVFFLGLLDGAVAGIAALMRLLHLLELFVRLLPVFERRVHCKPFEASCSSTRTRLHAGVAPEAHSSAPAGPSSWLCRPFG